MNHFIWIEDFARYFLMFLRVIDMMTDMQQMNLNRSFECIVNVKNVSVPT